MFERIRFHAAVGTAAIVAASVVACSSDPGSSGSGGAATSKCGATYTTANTTCSQSELDSYSSCPGAQCGSDVDACKSVCQSQHDCVDACACGDNACLSKCTPSADCKSCLTTAAKCVVSKCPSPACLSVKPASDGGAGADTGTGTGIGDSGVNPGKDAGTTAGGTCADLATCCAAIPSSDSDKSTCEYTVGSGAESTCSSELKYYRNHGKC